MAYTFEDFINVKVPEVGSREIISGDLASLKPMTPEEVGSMFPNIELTHSESIVYVPLTMCHSLPKVNARKRCFTSNTLANSFNSAVDSLIDREHLLMANGDLINENFSDQIIGHIKAARFTGTKLSSGNEIAAEPKPLYALAALYMRAAGVDQILKNHLNGTEKWRTSMECGHSWKDAFMFYRNEFIPIAEAPGQMLENVRADTILPYQGHEVAAVLGGLDGRVDFWGMALTTQPADDDVELLGMVAGLSRDLAKRKIFHVPIHGFRCEGNEKSLEVAGKQVDKKITELANIAVIGETEESDGHKHLILSDLTILPADGHDHYLDSKNISRGSKPVLTGRTGTHYTGIKNAVGERIDEIPHLHLVSVPLTGRFSSPQVSTGNSDGDVAGDSSSPEVSSTGDSDEMEIKEILKKLAEMSSQIASMQKGSEDNEFKEFAKSFMSLTTDLKEIASQDAINKAIQEEIDRRVEKGELLTKEKADEAVDAAVEEEKKKFDAEKKVAEVRSQRLERVKDAGINLDYEFDEIQDEDGKPMTIQKVLDGLDTDDAGERQFLLNFSSWKQIAEDKKKQQEEQQQAAEQQTDEQQAADAASKKNKSILATVGGDTSPEAASSPPSGTPKIGKHAVSTFQS